MPDHSKAVKAALLPQYQQSPAFMERFLDAIHFDDKEIERSPNSKGIKLVDGSELLADSLDYFNENKREMELEFHSELVMRIGQDKATLFCDIIAKDWFAGKRLINGPRVSSLKSSICNYITTIAQGKYQLSELVINHLAPAASWLLTPDEVAGILTINDQMLFKHIECWKALHPNADTLSDGDIFLRRGLSLSAPLNPNEFYQEWDYINSYSIAFSAPEKFSQMQSGRVPAIVNADIKFFSGRVLFFSPFIPGMKVGQLEAGIIPADYLVPIHEQGKFGDIYEYILDKKI